MWSCPPASTATVPVASARAMRGGVDAAGETRDDDEAGLAEFARDAARRISRRPPRHCASRRSRPSAAQRRSLPRTAISGGASSIIRRRTRIIGLAERDQADAHGVRRPRFRARLRAREQMRPAPAAPPRRARSGSALERRARAAVMIDQGAERARPDILAADEAQPVDPLLVGQANLASSCRPPYRRQSGRMTRFGAG